MFKVAGPLITLDHAENAATVSVFNESVKLSTVNVRLRKSIKQNRTKRQRGAARARQTMKY